MGPLLLAMLALHPTAAPQGPYRVDGNRILDARGRPYLIRGTELPPDGWTATALVTIRQRLNMNAVRLPAAGQDWPRVVQAVRVANRLELLAIAETDSAPPPELRGNPNVFFAVSTPAALAAVRASGATQPVVLRGFRAADANAIVEVAPRWADPASWRDWDEREPPLVDGLDPGLDADSPECAAFPTDPGEAERLVTERLAEFDRRAISWTISSFRPGRLITDYRYFVGTKLDDGWTCGQTTRAGLGLTLLSHLWGSDPHGLFAVNGDAGNYRLPIGGRATAYGPIFAEREVLPPPGPLPLRLGNVGVRIVDSRGVAHEAPLLYTGAGWAHISFVIPPDAAPGPAEVAVVRTDGTRSAAKAILATVAPGLMSASLDGRGVAKAWMSQAGSEVATFACTYDCTALPIGVPAMVRFVGTGFRNARSIRVMVGETVVPVVSFGPIPGEPGKDQLTVRLPEALAGAGESDVLMWADGALSNVVRIRPSSASSRSPRTASHTRRSPAAPSARK